MRISKIDKMQSLSKNQQIIFDLIDKSPEPLKAYTILFNVQKKGIKAPLQVYRALDKLDVIPEHILMDGSKFKPYQRDGEYISHTCVVKGDDKYASIAAASILAKVERDLYIENLCDKYPVLEERYNMRKNKGYGTKDHMNGIKEHGVTSKHRFSYKIVEEYSNIKDVLELN